MPDSINKVGTVVILAAGQGTRMKSARPKVLHPVCGRPLVAWVVDQALSLAPRQLVVVVGHGGESVVEAVTVAAGATPVTFVTQEPQLGTGHAVQMAAEALGSDPGRVVVLYGDMALLSSATLSDLVAAQEEGGMSLLTFEMDDPRGYGRILRSAGAVTGIVEERDASPQERAIDECNLGVYCFDGAQLLADLPRLTNDNDQGEYYLTDLVALAVEAGRAVTTGTLENSDEALGVNTIAHLAEVRWAMQVRILEKHMASGVYIEDPASTTIDAGVKIGAGTHILPYTVIRGGVVVGEGCEVGPFTHLRAGTVMADGAEVGNFTESKNSTLGAGVKAKHLSYLGDATIGAGTNVGAGTIFANYDGKLKHRTEVGQDAFIGSGTILVAPGTIGAGATTGAGAVVTGQSAVGADETWVGVPARPISRAADREQRADDATDEQE
ncbi:MAG: NTP transferase domain-containing protein [Planctomycetota bacterium]|nr:NTP transferase domain-containing protein [Planctomycetota bacterium]MDP6838619.1 NTP transferase domain-containing protein [Planctomycetota bacterium]MDP6956606.1 NTP transferase domain-containing protein [Planctomycetota bacterium]